MKYSTYIVILATVALTACSGGKVTPSCDEEYTAVKIERLDSVILAYDAPSALPSSMRSAVSLYLKIAGLDTMETDSAVMTLRDSQVYQVFGNDIAVRFDRADSVSSALGGTIGRLRSVLPDIKTPHVYGIASPYMQQVIVSDTTVFIALNHYLKPDYPGYGSLPLYRRKLKQPSRIPQDVAEALIRINRPYIPTANTLLEKMLYEGAVVKALEYATGMDRATIIGITPQELDAANRDLATWWQALAKENMIYSTSTADIARMLDTAPSTNLGTLRGPSRIGCIIALAIIDSYSRNFPDTEIQWYLTPDFYGNSQSNLIKSGFSPR